MSTTTSYFKKASKSLVKIKVAITGPSGSGKTYSSLLLAKGLGGRVAVIDSENNSASLYEDSFPGWEYFVLPINPPYTAQKYAKAIDLAVAEGFDVVIVDSLSHAWASEGGLLQQKEALDSRGGNSYTNWGSITKLYEALKAKILHSPIHVICTMRSKQEYILAENEKGKAVPKKVGMAPVMREGIEFEFTTVFDIGMDHQYMVSKDRTGLFDGVVACMSEDTGLALKDWLASPPATQQQPPRQEPKDPIPSEEPLFPEDSKTINHTEETENKLTGIPPAVKTPNFATFMIKCDIASMPEAKGKILKDLSEEQLVKIAMDIEKQFQLTPPPKNIAQLFEINSNIKSYLKLYS